MWRKILPFALCALVVGQDANAGPQPVIQRDFSIMLDAGHGGDNQGCLGVDGQREKHVTLALALELKAALARRLPHVEVVLTRERDLALPLPERVDQANRAAVDLFVSLHANASPTRTQAGFETYVLDAQASTEHAAQAAHRENGPDRGPATMAQSMVFELLQQVHRSAAIRLAARMQAAQAARFGGKLDRGVKQAPFDVLIGTKMPAVLFEAAFLDHPTDAKRLTDPALRAVVVDGLVDALVDHYRHRG